MRIIFVEFRYSCTIICHHLGQIFHPIIELLNVVGKALIWGPHFILLHPYLGMGKEYHAMLVGCQEFVDPYLIANIEQIAFVGTNWNIHKGLYRQVR